MGGVGQGYRGLEWYDTIASGRHHRGGCQKDFLFLKRSVGSQINEHGGKTGRAMIKYPLYKKNNSRNFTLLYPGLTTVSLDRIINL